MYNSETKDWVELNNLDVFKKFNLSFPLNNQKFIKPTRAPYTSIDDVSVNGSVQKLEEGFLQDYVLSFQKQIDKLLESNLELVNQNIQLKVDNTQAKTDKEIARNEFNSNLEKLRKENEFLKSSYDNAKVHIAKIEEEVELLRTSQKDTSKNQLKKLERLTRENNNLSKDLEKKERYISERNQEIRNILNDNMELQRQVDKLESLDTLGYQEQLQLLEGEAWALEIDKSLLEKDLHFKNEEIESLKLINEKVMQENEKLISQFDKIKKKNLELRSNHEKISSVINHKDSTIKKLMGQNSFVKEKYKKDLSEVKTHFDSYKKVLSEEKAKSKELAELLAQKEQVKKFVGKRTKHLKKKQKEVGKVFELSNEPIWEIKGHDLDDGLLRFTELREKFDNGEIDDSTYIRKEGSWWKKAKDTHELHAPVLIKEIFGEEKVYIERDSFRVPMSGTPIEIELISGSTLVGNCLNISRGGCFLEVRGFTANDIKNGDEFIVEIKNPGLPENFRVDATARRVDVEDRGVGVSFDNLTLEQEQIISDFINQFLGELDQAA